MRRQFSFDDLCVTDVLSDKAVYLKEMLVLVERVNHIYNIIYNFICTYLGGVNKSRCDVFLTKYLNIQYLCISKNYVHLKLVHHFDHFFERPLRYKVPPHLKQTPVFSSVLVVSNE